MEPLRRPAYRCGMKMIPVSLILLTVAACAPTGDVYLDNPKKRMVNVDDHMISVVPEGGNTYAAWGGAEDQDGFVQYRQRRSVELISGCRVDKVTSKKDDAMLRATVKC